MLMLDSHAKRRFCEQCRIHPLAFVSEYPGAMRGQVGRKQIHRAIDRSRDERNIQPADHGEQVRKLVQLKRELSTLPAAKNLG